MPAEAGRAEDGIMSAQVTRPLEPLRAYDEVKPNPDPSTATTAQLLRELENFRETIDARFEAFSIRLNAMDKAIELVARYPTEMDKAVGHLKEKTDMQLEAIKERLIDRDHRVSQDRLEARDNVSTAFSNAERAVAKSESRTDGQMAAAGGRIDELRERVGAIENIKKGSTENWGVIIGIGGFLIALVSVGFLIANNVGGG